VNDVLIPLDGSPLAEQVLGPALELARLMEARCSLLRVVPPHSTAGRGEGDPAEVTAAEEYLNGIAARLQRQGLQVRPRILVARNAAEAILKDAAAQRDSVIALATPGRGGLNRLLLGSVASKVVRAAAAPALIYRPTGKKT
jgi:nucleotide-binding universal stress UspA family protein